MRLTIAGCNFGRRRGKGKVIFGSFKATKYLRWSATRIICRVPDMPEGATVVKVRNAKGASRGKRFTVKPPTRATLPAGALRSLGTVGWRAMSSYWYGYAASPDPVGYYRDSSGHLGIVNYDATANSLAVDIYDPSTLGAVGETRLVSLGSWPIWGSFYAASDDCFYVAVGRENPNEDDNADVVAVRRYDRHWTLLGTAYIKGSSTPSSPAWSGISTPFRSGAPHMVLVGNQLVLHMSRREYTSTDGLRHQSNLTFVIDTDSMTANVFTVRPYCSHSFQQLVAMNGSSLVTIDHGDAYPRAIQLGVIAGYHGQSVTLSALTRYNVFAFNGTIGDNFTGAAVTGLASGPSGIVVVGNSIPQPDAPNGPLGSGDERRNAFAVWADPATGENTTRWLTDFAPQGAENGLEPRIVQVGADRYAILFSVESSRTGSSRTYRMEYRLIDSAGTVLASTSFPGVFFCAVSDPILLDGKVYWEGIEKDFDRPPAYLFGLDVSEPTTPSLLTAATP